MKLKILHLSDLHIKNVSTPQDLVLNSLQHKIEEISKFESIKALIVTGDIAFSGKEAEYDRAKQMLNQIILICKIDPRNIFFIPGNHDVDRSKIKPGHLDWWYKFKDESALQNILDSDEALPKIESTKQAYFTFTQEFMNKNIVVGKFGQFVHDIFIEPGPAVKVKIVGLNSALFCGYEGDDQGKLALGLEQVAYCENKVQPTKEIIISCIHHPFSCFHPCENTTIHVVKRFSDIILSGHFHEERNLVMRDADLQETVMISAGAGFENRLHNNSFNLIDIDLQDLSGQVVFYKYLPKEHTWIVNKDINHKNNGVFEFKFAKTELAPINRADNEMQPLHKASVFTYQIELSGEFEKLNRNKLTDFFNLLKTSLGDSNLKILGLEKGSTRIIFQTNVDNIEKIETSLRLHLDAEYVSLQKVDIGDEVSGRKVDQSVFHWNISVKSEFLSDLESSGANFIHSRVEDLKLLDLFVAPNLKRLKIEKDYKDRAEKVMNAEDALQKVINKEIKLVLYGGESSGKTTLLKWAFLRFYNAGFIPVLLRGDNIKDITEKKLRQLIQQELVKQYNQSDFLDISMLDPDRVIILIDDFHSIRFSQPKFKANLIANLLKISQNLVIAASDLLQLETYISKTGKTQNILEGFDRLTILEYGPKARYEIIKKWNGLGRTETDPNEVIRFNNETENYVESIIGKNFVPSFPIYLLTILQAKDAAIGQKPEYSLHGFYYELLINEALSKSVKNKEEISLFYNYITDYCYFLFIEKIRDIPVRVEDLNKFHENYCKEYNISVNLHIVLNTLINSKLLRLVFSKL